MRVRARLDRLSGVDVRAAVRHTRLPFVASLFLAMLLGAPTAAAAPAVEPARAPVAAEHSTISTPAEPAAVEPIIAAPAVTPLFAAPGIVRPATPALRDQALRAARAPRAPPQ